MGEITSVIENYNRERLPEMLSYKYKSMKENLFRFYRGTGHLFYNDISKDRVLQDTPPAWISGDLHLENFGSYKGANKQVYFDVNDFDDAILAPVGWELVRYITSVFIAFESLQIEQKRAMKMARLFLKKYADALHKGKPYYIEYGTAIGIIGKFLSTVSKRKQKDFLKKLTIKKKSGLQFLADDKKYFKIKRALKEELFEHINTWLKNDEHSPYNYEVIDGAFHLMGTSSIGLKRYAFLLRSTNKTGHKYILVDMKEAIPSAISPFTPYEQPAWQTEASRIITIQERMQNRSPALLSISVFQGTSYVMQEMQPSEDSINFRMLKDQYRDMYHVIDDMAMLAASSHLRSSGQQGSANTDILKKFGEDQSWQDVLLEYAATYSDKVKKEYNSYLTDNKEIEPRPEPSEI